MPLPPQDQMQGQPLSPQFAPMAPFGSMGSMHGASSVDSSPVAAAAASSPGGTPVASRQAADASPLRAHVSPALVPAPAPEASPPLPAWIPWRKFLLDFGEAAVQTAPPPSASGVQVTGPHAMPLSDAAPVATGRRRALLIGSNYTSAPAQMRSAHGDVANIRSTLLRVGFEDEDVLCLQDAQADLACLPTRRNILTALRWLTHAVVAGDVLFFHFSGHGTQVLDAGAGVAEAMDDAICPVDQQWAGHITQNQLFESMVKNLPSGVRLTALFDCCVPGVSFGLPWAHDMQHGWAEEPDAFHTLGDVVCYHLCSIGEITAEKLQWVCALPGGVLTTVFLGALRTLAARREGPVSHSQVMQQMAADLQSCPLACEVRMSASQRFDVQARTFRFFDAMPNRNPNLGLCVPRRHKAPRQWCGPAGVDGALRLPANVGPPPPYSE